MENLHEIAARIERAQRERRHAAHTKPWRPSATPATALGYHCERRIVLQRTRPELAAPIGEELASIFEEGNLHQRDVRSELSALGFEVVEAELNFRDTTLDITGTIDGKIEINDPAGRHGKRRVPIEIKSSAGNPPTTADALRDHAGLYGRYFAQMQTYLFLTSEPEGLFLFKDKITGLWSIVPVSLDYDYAEGLLRRAERVRDHVRAGTLPDRLADRSECGGCPWRDTECHPAESPCDPTLLAEDRALAAQLAAREEMKTTRDAWEAIDAEIKTRFRNTAGERFVCGDFLIVKKPHGKGVRIDIQRLAEKASEEK